MSLSGFLKMPGIDGESSSATHENEIDVFAVDWGVARQMPDSRSSGRVRSRANVENLSVQKFYDASSPYLALAAMQGKTFKEVVLTIQKSSGDAPLDYLVITMTNALITDYQMENEGKETDETQICEYIGLAFEKIKLKYTELAADQSAGDEHEIEFDVASPV